MASIYLSAAFNIVNIDLLMKQLSMLGLPDDLLSLIEIWLKKRFFYVDINGLISKLYEIHHGTIQFLAQSFTQFMFPPFHHHQFV